ncbi:MAG: TonB-dependent receptor, partial [bacterium]|nr:TonB-dependent receptor [bacterium]
MRSRKKYFPVFAVAVMFLGISMENLLWAQVEKEKLLFREIPVVITAARKEQPITQAPTTITVITAEDIKYSGAVSIPDVLRMVPGVDVMTITARDRQVGVRGFIGPINNKLLVLVDGRSVYTDFYGLVVWDVIPVTLEEIDRLEVIKSPASSIYGANAYSGVINIITKSPGQLKGTSLQLTGGGGETLIGSIIHAGEAAEKKINYKVSAQLDRTKGWEQNGKENSEVIRLNALLEYRINKKSKLAISGGRGRAKNMKLLSGESIGTGNVADHIDYLQFDFQYANLEFRTFLKREQVEVEWLSIGDIEKWDIASYDAELLHSFQIGKTHSLVWGINYRYNRLKKNTSIRRNHSQDLWALFLEDEITITPKLRVTLGGRYDRHPLVGNNFSPRGNIFYAPSEKHIIRFSIARAFRNPSFVDSYLYIRKPLTVTLTPPLPPIDIPYTFISQGNEALKPESITAYEIGYHSTLTGRLQLNLNLYYNQYADFFVRQNVVTYYGNDALFPGFPGGVFPQTVVTTVQNQGEAWGIGGEIQLDFLIKDGITGFINYA